MAEVKKLFNGLQFVKASSFTGTPEANVLYFVRTDTPTDKKIDGYLQFNGKKYGTGEDAIAAVKTFYGELNGKTIAKYVEDELAAIKGVTKKAFDEVVAESAANKAAIEKLNGAEDAEGSVAKAVKDAKDALVGDEATVDTIKHAEKAAADAANAASDEKTRAEGVEKGLRTDVDAKIANVEGANAIVATVSGDAGAKKATVSLKIAETQGNVVLEQSADGLKASISQDEIAKIGVSGVKEGEKVLSVADGKISSTIAFSVDANPGEDQKRYLRLTGIDGADLGKVDIADFVKDGMLDSAKYDTASHKLTLTFNGAAGKDAIDVDLSTLVDVYKAGNGLSLAEDGTFSIDTDVTATKDSVDTLAGRVSTLETTVGDAESGLVKGVADNKSAIADEATTARAAEKKNADAIAALETKMNDEAVTLVIPDDDKYIGVEKAADGNKYTIKSKADAIEALSKAAVEALDATVSGESNGVKVEIVETDGKLASVAVTAPDFGETYDAKGAAAAVQANLDTFKGREEGFATKAQGVKADSAVQSVNGKAATAVTISGADIATDQTVGETTGATVNTVLADIYKKIGAVAVTSTDKSIKVGADGRDISVNVEEATDALVGNGHIAIMKNAEGALYAAMYCLGDDVE